MDIINVSDLFNREEVRDLYNYTDKTIFIELQKHVIKVLAEIIMDYYTEFRMEFKKAYTGVTIEQLYTRVSVSNYGSYLFFRVHFNKQIMREYTIPKRDSYRPKRTNTLKLTNTDMCPLHGYKPNDLCTNCNFPNELTCEQYKNNPEIMSLWNIIYMNVVDNRSRFFGENCHRSLLRSIKLDNNIFPSTIPIRNIKDYNGSITHYKIINKLYENDIVCEFDNVERVIERVMDYFSL
jgi:hypothetical protein